MAWNEPGGGKDPWGGNRGNDGPPDIDEALKKLAEKFQFFGSGGSGGGIKGLLPIVLAVLAILWGLMGFYQVDSVAYRLYLEPPVHALLISHHPDRYCQQHASAHCLWRA